MLITDAALNVCSVMMHAVKTDRDFTDIKELVKECEIPEEDFVSSINKVEDFIADMYAITSKIKNF